MLPSAAAGLAGLSLSSVEVYNSVGDDIHGAVLGAQIAIGGTCPMEPAVGGIVELRTSPDAQRDQPASDSSLPLPASVAFGLLVMGAGGLYVVRMRRG